MKPMFARCSTTYMDVTYIGIEEQASRVSRNSHHHQERDQEQSNLPLRLVCDCAAGSVWEVVQGPPSNPRYGTSLFGRPFRSGQCLNLRFILPQGVLEARDTCRLRSN